MSPRGRSPCSSQSHCDRAQLEASAGGAQRLERWPGRGQTGHPAALSQGHSSLQSARIQRVCLLSPRTQAPTAHLESQAQQVKGVPKATQQVVVPAWAT